MTDKTALSSSKQFLFPVLNEDVEAIAALIAAGASLEGRVDSGRYNYTPLGLAALELKRRSVEALLDGGADIDFVGPSGLRPIQHAFGSASRDTKEQTGEMVAYLVGRGATVTESDVARVHGALDSGRKPMYSDEVKTLVREAFERRQAPWPADPS